MLTLRENPVERKDVLIPLTAIEKYAKATAYHQQAAKYHLDAVKHHEAGNHDMAYESAIIANGYAYTAVIARTKLAKFIG